MSTTEPVGTADHTVARLERLPFGRFHLRIASLLGVGTFFDAFAFTADRVGRKPWFVSGFALAAVGGAFGLIAVLAGLTSWPVLFVAGLLMGRLASVFVKFGIVAAVGMVVMAWLGIETKQRVPEELAR